MDIGSIRTPARMSKDFVKISSDTVSRSEFDALHRRIEALEMGSSIPKTQVSTGRNVVAKEGEDRDVLRARQAEMRKAERERIANLRTQSSGDDLKTTSTGAEIRKPSMSNEEFEKIAAAHLAEARAILKKESMERGEKAGTSSMGVTSTGKSIRPVRSIPLDSDIHREKVERDREYMRMRSTGAKVVKQRDITYEEDEQECDC